VKNLRNVGDGRYFRERIFKKLIVKLSKFSLIFRRFMDMSLSSRLSRISM